jgi:hypothetical protein
MLTARCGAQIILLGAIVINNDRFATYFNKRLRSYQFPMTMGILIVLDRPQLPTNRNKRLSGNHRSGSA